jgi:hypothetical protein
LKGNDVDQTRNELDCAGALHVLARGQFSEWTGLPSDCARAHAEEVLGPTASGPDGAGILGDSPAAFRIYPATSVAPYGLMVWFAENKIVAVQINQPKLDRPLNEQIGEPEYVAPSMLKTLQKQWIYASRGLSAHVSGVSGSISSIYAFPATTVEEYLRSSLSRVSSRRIPLR